MPISLFQAASLCMSQGVRLPPGVWGWGWVHGVGGSSLGCAEMQADIKSLLHTH